MSLEKELSNEVKAEVVNSFLHTFLDDLDKINAERLQHLKDFYLNPETPLTEKNKERIGFIVDLQATVFELINESIALAVQNIKRGDFANINALLNFFRIIQETKELNDPYTLQSITESVTNVNTAGLSANANNVWNESKKAIASGDTRKGIKLKALWILLTRKLYDFYNQGIAVMEKIKPPTIANLALEDVAANFYFLVEDVDKFEQTLKDLGIFQTPSGKGTRTYN